MKLLYTLLILFIVTLFDQSAFAQKKDATWIGAADGVVRDSVHNYILQSATLAVYNAKDSSLMSYQLSNNFGEFHFKGLPDSIPLYIVASYMGYTTIVKNFTISLKNKKIDLKNINLERSENNLQDVVVKSVPPVTMNGDTLEFNADAFKMDPNAVTEDLLRKLPGVIVWGDGTITVNGKQVSSVLVNGKPFFGGDTKVATQNLPKDAVDKIQVYQQNKDPNNPLDSITQINIKLKKKKSFGHFGKLAAGYGSDKHYESDANINFFTNQTQFGIVGATNNINKVANDVTTLMRNSTYKGVGASIEYQPDFRMEGINRPLAGGFTFQHDFIPDVTYYNSNRLKANYFIQNNNNNILRTTQMITSLGGDSTQLQKNASSTKASNTGQNFTVDYDKHKDNNTITASGGFNTNNSNNQSINKSSTSSSGQGLQSTNDAAINSYSNGKNILFSAGLSHQKDMPQENRLPGNIDIQYAFNAGSTEGDHTNKTDFISLSDPTQNKSVDRRYQNSVNTTQQHISFALGDFSKWIFGYWNFMTGISTKLENNLDVHTQNENNLVQDRDTITGSYSTNQYLTNRQHSTTLNELPALNFGKTFMKALANRYQKSLSINVLAQAQFYYQKNNSSHAFQNITQHYQRFVPTAGITYQNYEYGTFQDIYTMNFGVSSDFPTIAQLVPLVDSSNLYYIQQGNLSLRPTRKKELSFSFRHTSIRSKNTFNYNANISAGNIDHYYADSSLTDTLGRSTHYTVNADGNKFFNGAISLNKAFKFANHQIQINYNGSVNLSKSPSYINSKLSQSVSLYNNNNLNLYYTYKDKLAINLIEGYSHYQSKQTGINNTFGNNTQSTSFSTSFNCTKKLTVSSNLTYNHATSTGSDATNYTIWNANATYRFMKGNNLELKLSALDLLHQNTSIINYGSNNMLTHGTVNVLQQYFMFTLSYFPRKFGKKEKN